MSQENVEVVRQHIDAYAAGDGERALSFVDPEVVGQRRAARRTDWTRCGV